jgi:hypothetical protein
MLALVMALHSKRIDYTVYSPNYEPGKGCWDYRTATKARLAAIKLGTWARIRRNVNVTTKNSKEVDWCVDRVWEWNGGKFVDVTKNPGKGLP